MSRGPLAVRYLDWTLAGVQAGAPTKARMELENAGDLRWTDQVFAAYHWLDERDNPIVWDGDRTPLPPLAPGERATVELDVRGPIPSGRYRFAVDLVAEHRAWFSALGSPFDSREIEVAPRSGQPNATFPPGVEPAADWAERVAAAHAEGYGVVAGSIVWKGSSLRRRPHELEPYEPRPGRIPSFSYPLLCPSVLNGIELERLPDVAGLPAYAPPAAANERTPERWIYDGSITLNVDRDFVIDA